MRERTFSIAAAVAAVLALRPELAKLQDQELAARCGYSPSNWSHIKNGYLHGDRAATLVRLCIGLQVDLLTFLRLGGLSEETVRAVSADATDDAHPKALPRANSSARGRAAQHNGAGTRHHSPRQRGRESDAQVRTIAEKWSRPFSAYPSLSAARDTVLFGDAASLGGADTGGEGVRHATNTWRRRIPPESASRWHGGGRKAPVDHPTYEAVAA